MFNAYNEEVDEELSQMIRSHPGATTYFRNGAGRIVVNLPWNYADYWRRTLAYNPVDYIERKIDPNADHRWNRPEQRPSSGRPARPWSMATNVGRGGTRCRDREGCRGDHALGLQKKGDRLAILSANSAEFIMVSHAASRLGRSLCRSTPDWRLRRLRTFCSTRGSAMLAFRSAESSLAASSAAASGASLVSLGPSADHPDVLTGGCGDPIHEDRACESDDALILYTSGTTGKPKGSLMDHHRAVWAAMAQIASLGVRRGPISAPGPDVPLRRHDLPQRDHPARRHSCRDAQVRRAIDARFGRNGGSL